MPQNTTEKEKVAALAPAQLSVLEALLRGETTSAAAISAGIDRSTVYRWLRSDNEFRAALNSGRMELLGAVQSKVMQIAKCAADTVSRAVTEGDVQASIAVLKGIGALPGTLPPIGSDDPAELVRQAAAVTRQTKEAAALGEIEQRRKEIEALEQTQNLDLREMLAR